MKKLDIKTLINISQLKSILHIKQPELGLII